MYDEGSSEGTYKASIVNFLLIWMGSKSYQLFECCDTMKTNRITTHSV